MGVNGASRTDTFAGAIGPRIFTDANIVSFVSTNGPDNLLGTGQNDTIDGAAGNDTLEGSAGDDELVGGAGTDTVI